LKSIFLKFSLEKNVLEKNKLNFCSIGKIKFE